MNLKTKILYTGIILLGLIPVFLLFLFGPNNFSSLTHVLGQITGLMGMTYFSISFVLSARISWIEDFFGGLDKIYPFHALLGSLSLVLILGHPLLLISKFIPNNIDLAAKYLLLGGFLSVDLGIYALVGMIILIMITLYSKIRYDRWKFSHKMLGIVFIFAVLHIFLVRQDVAEDYIFRGYFVYALIISIIGLLSFFYSLFRMDLIGKKYKIKDIKYHKNSFDIFLSPIGEGIKFDSGQFVFVRFYNSNISKESHPFSIASPSGKGELRIVAKKLGDYTSQLSELRIGDKVLVEGPYGKFHKKNNKSEVWVAGGIGITPFLGLAADSFGHKKEIYLFYCVKDKEDIIGFKELREIEKNNMNFHLYLWISSIKGHINLDYISNIVFIKDKEFYLCGPEGLKSSIKSGLIKKGISQDSIHDERFTFK